jgi:hypothetical protein
MHELNSFDSFFFKNVGMFGTWRFQRYKELDSGLLDSDTHCLKMQASYLSETI